MGDISIIARRLENGQVQYGWSGSGGYFRILGTKLLQWYNSPDSVDYLFSLGETAWIGLPHSELGGYGLMNTHRLTGCPHTIGKTEREIFSKIAFIDYGYFYDLDNKWYYVTPSPFRMKYPLELISHHLNANDCEFDFLRESESKLIKYIFSEYLDIDSEFNFLITKYKYIIDNVLAELITDPFPIHKLYDNYRAIFSYFDDWVVVESDESFSNIIGFKIRQKVIPHTETNEW